MLTAVPDRRRRPADGLVIQASITARLFGLRLLSLDATVVVSPAEVSGSPPPPAAARGVPARPLVRADGAVGAPAGVGPGLAEAVRSIDEGAAILAKARDARPA